MAQYKKFDEKSFEDRLKEGSIKVGSFIEFVTSKDKSTGKNFKYVGYFVQKALESIVLAPSKIENDGKVIMFLSDYFIKIENIDKYRIIDIIS